MIQSTGESSGSNSSGGNTSRSNNNNNAPVLPESRSVEAAKQLFCGGIAGSVAKTVTAPLSRLTILFQVHSLVTTKEHRPKFAMNIREGFGKIIERGGFVSLWRGNLTSVIHRFPYSGINFLCYSTVIDIMSENFEEPNETSTQLARRMSHKLIQGRDQDRREGTNSSSDSNNISNGETQAYHKFIAGAIAGCTACVACYPLDLVRTRLTTEFEGREHYRGIIDAVRKIRAEEGWRGFYSGLGPTLGVAVPNLAISFSVYGTMKEYALDDELFYNLRRIDDDSGEERMGFILTVMCGATSGIMATMLTFP